MEERMIRRLYHGALAPDRRDPRREEGYQPAMEEILRLEAALGQVISRENAPLLEELSSAYARREGIVAAGAFADGFALGIQLLTQALGRPLD